MRTARTTANGALTGQPEDEVLGAERASRRSTSDACGAVVEQSEGHVSESQSFGSARLVQRARLSQLVHDAQRPTGLMVFHSKDALQRGIR